VNVSGVLSLLGLSRSFQVAVTCKKSGSAKLVRAPHISHLYLTNFCSSFISLLMSQINNTGPQDHTNQNNQYNQNAQQGSGTNYSLVLYVPGMKLPLQRYIRPHNAIDTLIPGHCVRCGQAHSDRGKYCTNNCQYCPNVQWAHSGKVSELRYSERPPA